MTFGIVVMMMIACREVNTVGRFCSGENLTPFVSNNAPHAIAN